MSRGLEPHEAGVPASARSGIRAYGRNPARVTQKMHGKRMSDVEAKIRDIIAKEAQIDASKLTLDAKLAELDIESIDLVSIIYNIEEEYDIYIPQDDEQFKLETFRDVVDGVNDLIAKKGAEPSSSAAS
jgi:acyl carrier protein